MQISKKVRVDKCKSQELFIAMSNVKNKLLNKVAKNEDCMSIPGRRQARSTDMKGYTGIYRYIKGYVRIYMVCM